VPQLRQVTFRRGVTGRGRFAPDGQTIVYAAQWDGPPLRVYTTRVDSPESRSLGLPPADVLSVSSTGELALALEAESGDVLATVPLSGGAPREILVGVLEADWRPGGTDLAVIRRGEGKMRLEYPIGKMLVESTNILHSLHFSPQGDRLAYVESVPLLGGSICVVDLNGARRVLESDSKTAELVWSRDGRALWVTRQSIPEGVTELRTLSLSGRSRPVQRFADTVRLYDSSSTGRLLVERVWFRSEIHGYPPGGGPEVALAWLDGSEPMGLSADGRMILLNEWARRAVFARPTDGGPAVRLGEGSARALSPDGKWALVSRTAPSRLALVPTGPGQTREFPLGTLQMGRAGGAAFLPDGSGAVFGAREPGKPLRSYRLDFGTAAIRPVTVEGTAGTCISPDGLRLLVEGPDGFALQSLAADTAIQRVSGLVPGDEPIRFASDGRVVFAAHGEGLSQKVFSVDTTNGSRKLLREFQPVDPAGVLGAGLVDLTPDARFWVHGYMRDLSDFYVIDGLP
jgi:Tol biopolymer transport system component